MAKCISQTVNCPRSYCKTLLLVFPNEHLRRILLLLVLPKQQRITSAPPGATLHAWEESRLQFLGSPHSGSPRVLPPGPQPRQPLPSHRPPCPEQRSCLSRLLPLPDRHRRGEPCSAAATARQAHGRDPRAPLHITPKTRDSPRTPSWGRRRADPAPRRPRTSGAGGEAQLRPAAALPPPPPPLPPPPPSYF